MHMPVFAALTLLVATAGPVAAQPVSTTAGPTTLMLVAESTVDVAPDVADIGAGVMTEAPDARTALAENAAAMSRVIAALRKAGIADRDIQTTGLTVAPQYRFQPNEVPTLRGFQASNRVQARIRDPKSTGAIVDGLVAAGANQLDGPTFTIDKPAPLLDKARSEAVAIARRRADLYAAAAGLGVVRILSIRESSAEDPMPRPMGRMEAMAADVAPYVPPPSPVAPGQVRLSASVQVTFALE